MDINNVVFSGLVNLGNTCFLNTCIQIMSNTQELNKMLDNLKHVKNIEDAIILNEYNGLIKMMNGNNIISPKRFIHYVQKVATYKGKTMFTGYEQNDMPEFLIFLLDCIHNSICRPITVNISGIPKIKKDNLAIVCYKHIKEVYEKEYSEIMDIFYGMYVSDIKSISGKVYSSKPEYYNILDLPMTDDTQSIYDCFDIFTNIDVIYDYINDNTKSRETVNKQIYFWSFPKILILCLKRYNKNIRKRNKMIKCPAILDLNKYTKGYDMNNIYELYAVCNHMGNIFGGHYTSYVKKQGVWYHINDEKVSILKENVISPKSYCLFYRKKNS